MLGVCLAAGKVSAPFNQSLSGKTRLSARGGVGFTEDKRKIKILTSKLINDITCRSIPRDAHNELWGTHLALIHGPGTRGFLRSEENDLLKKEGNDLGKRGRKVV